MTPATCLVHTAVGPGERFRTSRVNSYVVFGPTAKSAVPCGQNTRVAGYDGQYPDVTTV